MCPNCRAFISPSDRVCPYCEVELGPKPVDVRPSYSDEGGFLSHSRFTTTILLVINFGLYAATTLYSMQSAEGQLVTNIDPRTLVIFGAKFPPAMYQGQWWRLITAGFLHGGIIHILMNSWVLFDLGATVEEFFGTRRYVVIYFLSTIFGFAASTWWSNAISIGASAGLFGFIGAMIALGMRSRSTIGASMRSHYTQWALWGLAMGFLPTFRSDNAAHLGGLAAGFLTAYIAGTPKLAGGFVEKIWGVLAWTCLAITILSFAIMLSEFSSYRQ
jgi:rhomboid protease GluP